MERRDYMLARMLLDLAEEICGKAGVAVVAALLANGPMRDEDLSKITGLNIISIRSVVGQLLAAGLLSVLRERESINWVNYYYFVDRHILRAALRERIQKSAELLYDLVDMLERNELLRCPNCSYLYRLEETVVANPGNELICPVCGAKLVDTSDVRQRVVPLLKNLIRRLSELWRSL